MANLDRDNKDYNYQAPDFSTPIPSTPLTEVNETPAFKAGTPGKTGPTLRTISDETKDAFKKLEVWLSDFGIGSLATELNDYMINGMTSDEALMQLKLNPNGAYAKRFAGNAARVKQGLNALSENAYVALENSYANTLKSYGLGNMLSVNPQENQKTFAEYMANNISDIEFEDRIAQAEDKVINADAATKKQFKQWYPSLTDKDLVAYFLNPADTIGKLKEKVAAAEIGGVFNTQGLGLTEGQAADLAKFGIDRAGAIEGVQQIKESLPTANKLSSIYNEAGINYTQNTGIDEFLKKNQDAADKRKRLKSMERAQFSGDSGFTAQSGALGNSLQGKF